MKKVTAPVYRVRGIKRREDRGRMSVGRFLIGLFALVALLSLSAGGAGAFKPEDLARLKATNKCVDCDLRGANLSGANLSGAILNGANLREANLSGADLTSANLHWANLVVANLGGANLHWANLSGANLSGANLIEANLSLTTWVDGRICAKDSREVCK